METIYFWSNWNKVNKALLFLLLSIFAVTLILYTTAYYTGTALSIQWDHLHDFETVSIPVDQFTLNQDNYTLNADNFLVNDRYTTQPVKVIPLLSYVYLFFLITGVLVILTVLTYLDLWYYLAGMTVFLFFLGYMQTEMLHVFGLTDKKFLAAMLLVFAITSYLFQSYIKPSLWIRLTVFTIITVIIGLLIGFKSGVKNPFMYISNFGIIIPICIVVLFLLIIAFDVIKGFLYISSSSKNGNGKASLKNFSIISLLYLSCLLLLFLKKRTYIDWNLVYVDVFLLYIISAVIGLWSYRKRSLLFQNILPFAPYGAFFYLGLAIISTSTIAYAFATANDPLIEAFEYAILLTHFCVGFTFFIYVIFNFSSLFAKNINVYKSVYQANTVPFFMVRGIGFVAILAVYLYSRQMPYRLTSAGYHNTIGDVYYAEGDIEMAKQYYHEGFVQGNLSHHSNYRSSYSLATIYHKENNIIGAASFYENSILKNPKIYSFVGLSNIYFSNEKYFQALFVLKDGLQRFPKTGELYNNMGLVYQKLNINDSAVYCFNRAKEYMNENPAPVSNLIFLLVKKGLVHEADSLSQSFTNNSDINLQTNRIVINNINGKQTDSLDYNFISTDSTFSNSKLAFFNNYSINKIRHPEPRIINQILKWLPDTSYIYYTEGLQWLQALTCYYSHDKQTAFDLLQNLKANTNDNYTYSHTLGIWMMQQGLYDQAADEFNHCIQFGKQESVLNYCIASFENKNFNEPMTTLNALIKSGDMVISKKAQDLLMLEYAHTSNSIAALTEELKLKYLHYYRDELSEETLNSILQSLSNENLIVLASAEAMKYYTDRHLPEKAQALWDKMGKYEKVSEYVIGNAHYQYLNLLKEEQNWKQLKEEVKDIYLNPTDEINKLYFLARAQEGLGDSAAALNLYRNAIKESPFNTEVISDAYRFMNAEHKEAEAYDILVDAIQYNPYNHDILVAYFKQSVQMNMFTYAETVLPRIEITGSKTEITALKKLLSDAYTSGNTF